ncbi:MAG: tripartite tricarboxylate transporter substrate binding protein [Burkholderiales bacterium]|nr:tripartite tricarboxylate transporter substrate binding protein [Burkholderiales bacterium]MDE1925571.1 tripartite tricarboxylate transporter substrate binding protein [Burkholderiales bacterium]MDE2157935.1 tripartite tricarboxylate transporter substrate binding protein [Burkholderiales bacterium]MDE2503268.1 tripartite tricarboxylate transporter substrate binding protein [Burkholderiales bacterium]
MAQGAPEHPVTAIVGYAPGGAADLMMRKLAMLMQPKFPAGLIVINKPGAGGATALAAVATGKPDGSQFIFAPNSNVALAPQVNALPYKNPDDITPVINVASFAPLLVVPKDSPIKTAKDLVEAARKPGAAISIGFPGVATISHLNVVGLERASGAKFIPVPFTGWGQAAPQLLGGQISASIAQPIEVTQMLEAGKLRALGSFSNKRQPGLDEVPTFKEQGYNVAFEARYLVAVANGTPAATVKYLHDAFKAAMETTDFKNYLNERGTQVEYQDGPTARKALWADYDSYKEILPSIGSLK